MPAFRHQRMNSSVPTSLVSVVFQAIVEADRALVPRADAVLPVVVGDEIAAGIADAAAAFEVRDELEHVAAEAVLVGGRVAGLVDAAVDGAAEMLEEGAVDAVVDGSDLEIPVDRNARLHVRRLPFLISLFMVHTRI